jgi:hypothetical protein
MRLRGLEAGVYDMLVLSESFGSVGLDISYQSPQPAPLNVGCVAPTPLIVGEPALVDLALAGEELATACETGRPDLGFSLTLEAASDVLLLARSLDGLGSPRLSLRRPECDIDGAEIACRSGAPAELRARALPAGDYVVGVSASGPSRVELIVELDSPSQAPASDICAGAPSLPLNAETPLSLVGHVDDVAAGCQPGFVDAAGTLDLVAATDLLAIARFSPGDGGAVSLATPDCELSGTLSCAAGGARPVRVSRHDLAAGTYTVVVESRLGLPATVTLASRPAQAPILVPGADGCVDVVAIGENGGFYRGNTGNATGDFTASCDFATPSGAPDQLLSFSLSEPRRVIVDARGSDFETLVNIRRGAECPGQEVNAGCAISQAGDRSFLDLDLPAGEYFVQVDGYAGASGAWLLDVFFIDP